MGLGRLVTCLSSKQTERPHCPMENCMLMYLAVVVTLMLIYPVLHQSVSALWAFTWTSLRGLLGALILCVVLRRGKDK